MTNVGADLVPIGDAKEEFNAVLRKLADEGGGLVWADALLLENSVNESTMKKEKSGILRLDADGMTPYYYFAQCSVADSYSLLISVSGYTVRGRDDGFVVIATKGAVAADGVVVDAAEGAKGVVPLVRYRIRVLGGSVAYVLLDRLVNTVADACVTLKSFDPKINVSDVRDYKGVGMLPLITAGPIDPFDDFSALRFGVLLAPVRLVGITLLPNSYVATFNSGDHCVRIECHEKLGHYAFSGTADNDRQVDTTAASLDGVIAEIVMYLEMCGSWVPPASLIWGDAQWVGNTKVVSAQGAVDVLNQVHDLADVLNQLLNQ